MIKITDNKNPLAVDFVSTSNTPMSGTLLTYEITGEACVLVGSDRIWIPFSNLSKTSRNKILNTATKSKEKTSPILKEPRLFMIITLMVLIVFSYYYLKFNF